MASVAIPDQTFFNSDASLLRQAFQPQFRWRTVSIFMLIGSMISVGFCIWDIDYVPKSMKTCNPCNLNLTLLNTTTVAPRFADKVDTKFWLMFSGINVFAAVTVVGLLWALQANMEKFLARDLLSMSFFIAVGSVGAFTDQISVVFCANLFLSTFVTALKHSYVQYENPHFLEFAKTLFFDSCGLSFSACMNEIRLELLLLLIPLAVSSICLSSMYIQILSNANPCNPTGTQPPRTTEMTAMASNPSRTQPPGATEMTATGTQPPGTTEMKATCSNPSGTQPPGATEMTATGTQPPGTTEMTATGSNPSGTQPPGATDMATEMTATGTQPPMTTEMKAMGSNLPGAQPPGATETTNEMTGIGV